jgi:hypothetical protein
MVQELIICLRLSLRAVRLANKPLAHELESSAVIEGSKPDKSVLIGPVLANLSNRVKRGVGPLVR